MNFMENKKPSAGTIARLICLVLAAANQVFLLKTGHSLLPIESGELEVRGKCLGVLEKQQLDQRGNRRR